MKSIYDEYIYGKQSSFIYGTNYGIECYKLNEYIHKNPNNKKKEITYSDKKYSNEFIFTIHSMKSKYITIGKRDPEDYSIIIKEIGSGICNEIKLNKEHFINGYLDITTEISNNLRITAKNSYLRLTIVKKDKEGKGSKHLLSLNKENFNMTISYKLNPISTKCNIL